MIPFSRYGYQLTGKGKWSSLALKKPKQAGGKKNKKKQNQKAQGDPWAREGMDEDDDVDADVRSFSSWYESTVHMLGLL